jgi:hypothetical protein
VTRILGLLSQEMNFHIQASANKPSEKNKVVAEGKHAKLSRASDLLTNFNQNDILKTLRLLDSVLLMFVQKHDEEAWLERKLKLLFSPMNGGPALFASLMQAYLHLAVNIFELGITDSEPAN